jgi:hypothetical protein
VADYASFLESKRQHGLEAGVRAIYQAEYLYDFQRLLLDWALWTGRAAVLADCGLGKTPIQLAWAQNIVEVTNKPVLILAPLGVVNQTIREAQKFSIPAIRSHAGELSGRAEIVVTNYERLHQFDPLGFAGMVCDESSILKNFDGVTKAAIAEFMRRMAYRLLCTATAAPNDYIELGTSSEALGQMGYIDMLTMFFKNDEGSISPLSYASKWRFKPHAAGPFWRWLCTWARAIRKPSDLNCDDARFVLPALNERVQIVAASRPMNGQLFVMPARTLPEQREERRATITERCERAASIHASHTRPYLAWCHLNDEGRTLSRLLPDAVEVSGADDDEEKIEKFDAFQLGQVRGLITKAKIGGFGLNWQHCSDVTTFPSHSFEQYYQGIRRCWRYGQTRPVTVDIISTEGEADVMGSLRRKQAAADQMFTEMIAAMHHAMGVTVRRAETARHVPLPAWLQRTA